MDKDCRSCETMNARVMNAEREARDLGATQVAELRAELERYRAVIDNTQSFIPKPGLRGVLKDALRAFLVTRLAA